MASSKAVLWKQWGAGGPVPSVWRHSTESSSPVHRGRPGASWEPARALTFPGRLSFLCILAWQRYKFNTRECQDRSAVRDYTQCSCAWTCLSHASGEVGERGAWEMSRKYEESIRNSVVLGGAVGLAWRKRQRRAPSHIWNIPWRFTFPRSVLLKLSCAHQSPGDLVRMQILTYRVWDGAWESASQTTLQRCCSASPKLQWRRL